jgi:tetratricopeptide (TPR) repeat protein
MLDENVPPDEALIVDSAEAVLPKRVPLPNPPVRVHLQPKTRWSVLPKWGFAAAACVIVLVAGLLVRRGNDANLQLAGMQRTFEGRLSGQPYSQFTRSRSAQAKSSGAPDTQSNRVNGNELELGRLYLSQHNFDQAISYLELARERQPSSPQVHNDLGVAYMESAQDGALQKALNEFETALKLDARYEPALFNLALVYERLGQFGEAERRLKLYLQVDPASGWAKEVRSKL